MPKQYRMRLRATGRISLVAEGDSLTAGFGSIPWTQPFAQCLPQATVYNVATSGARLGDNMIGEGASQVDANYDAAAVRNFCVLWAGTNDIMNAPQRDAATVYGYMQAWCAARRAAHPGWFIIVLNSINGSTQSVRDQFNALLAADHSFCDAFIDVATLAETYATKPTWWQADHLHLTADGHTNVPCNEVVKAVLKAQGL